MERKRMDGGLPVTSQFFKEKLCGITRSAERVWPCKPPTGLQDLASPKRACKKVVAVVPAYNESHYIQSAVRAIKKFVDDVIVVDDGSNDDCGALAEKAGATVLHHAINMGLGFTLRTGVEAAIRDGADVIVTIDGDGQHDPSEIPVLLKTLLDDKLDVVIGYRPPGKDMPALKKIGNQGIFLLEKMLFGAEVVDTQSGFRAFRASAWPALKWESDRYAVSSEIVKNIGQNRLRFKEVPIKTIYNEKYKGTSVFDGLKIGAHMLWWKIGGR